MSAWTAPGYADGWTVPGYVEERLVGTGASGRVVAAVSETTGQRVAIKYLSSSMVRDPAFMGGFRTEAETLKSLDVPQVVQLYDYIEAPGQGAAIVMELVDGVSLHEMIKERGPTTPESALAALKGSLLGLAAAHAIGIVHRDYKPENVLIDSAGNSKLSDFGVAVKAGKQAVAAGTPLYMAPEQWNGAPSSPATDVYAATAVFYECLTAKTPFSGKLMQLREQHETAPVPLAGVDESVQSLITRGMAKNPLDRPESAIAFVAEVEAAAAAAYGEDWEERGRSHLAERVAALLPLLLLHGGPGSSVSSVADSWLRGGRRLVRAGRRNVMSVMTIAAAVLVAVGVIATAVALHSRNDNLANSSQAAAITPTYTVQAAVNPPVQSTQCATPATFAFSGTITATAPGTVSYRWLYSSGKLGPVQDVTFAAAGDRQVTGDTVSTKTAGNGWGEIQLVSPAGTVSNKANYQLVCAGATAGYSATATVQPATLNLGTCGPPSQSLTAKGSITSPQAGTVTYYWALSDGIDSEPANITFTKAGTMAVAPTTITPVGQAENGSAVLVVTEPVSAASSAAKYTVTCNVAAITAAAKVTPATQNVTSCTGQEPSFTFSGTITDSLPGPVSYYWNLPSGPEPTQTVTFAGPGTLAVTSAKYQASSDTQTGSGSLVVTSPVSATSSAAAFKVTCGAPLTITGGALAAGTVGTAYTATVTSAGGTGTKKYTATGLPAGLVMSTAGAITGTPTAAGTSTITVTVTDTATPVQTAKGTFTLAVTAPALTITGGALAAGTVNVAYAATVTSTGGTGTKTYTATGLPAGLVMSAAGAISGTPTVAGASTITVTVTDTATPVQTATGTFTLTIAAPALTITVSAPGTGTVGVGYSGSVTSAGGTGTKTYTATGLPAGLNISAAGAISGTPTTAGSFSVTFTVTDTATPVQTATATAGITISPPATPPLALSPAGGALPAGTIGSAYSASVSATGGAGTKSFRASGLPAGLSMSSGGTISGTPTGSLSGPVTSTVTVTVTDTASPVQTATGTYTITINPLQLQ